MEDAELAAAIAEVVPGTRVVSLVRLSAGPRAHSHRADVSADGRAQTWFIKRFPKPSAHAAQEFNSYARLRGVVGVTPALIASDPQRRLLIVEYVSDALDLFGALRRADDPCRVTRALGAVMTRLVLATRQPPSLVEDVAIREGAALAAAWPRVEAWAGELGVRGSDAVSRAITSVQNRYAHPPRASLTQGDPAPSNVVFLPNGKALLVDFEYGAQRHVLADMVQWSIRCPLPTRWFEAIVDEVRRALIGAGIYGDVETFHDDLAHVASYAALYMLSWLPIQQALAEDPPWVGTWQVRQALLSSSARGMRAARSAPTLAPLADWFAALNTALTHAWPASGDGSPDWTATVVGTSA